MKGGLYPGTLVEFFCPRCDQELMDIAGSRDCVLFCVQCNKLFVLPQSACSDCINRIDCLPFEAAVVKPASKGF